MTVFQRIRMKGQKVAKDISSLLSSKLAESLITPCQMLRFVHGGLSRRHIESNPLQDFLRGWKWCCLNRRQETLHERLKGLKNVL